MGCLHLLGPRAPGALSTAGSTSQSQGEPVKEAGDPQQEVGVLTCDLPCSGPPKGPSWVWDTLRPFQPPCVCVIPILREENSEHVKE